MGEPPFPVSRHARYFEDYPVGDLQEHGSIEVREEDAIGFALRFDPQYFHVDPEAAKASPYGGLILSGWHTAALTMRLLVDHVISAAASMGSPGVRELKWILPVRPGDVLSIRVKTLSARRSRSKPDRGLVGFFVETINQRRETVMTMETVGFYRCRGSA